MAKRQAAGATESFRDYAVVGAEHRLLQIAEEAARIFAAFPELRDPGRGFMAGVSGGAGRGTSARRRGGRRGPRKMSAAARKRISDAQKARWARHRANK